MKHLTATILIAIGITTLPLFAVDKTEDKIQSNLEQRVEKLNTAFKRFQEFKKAYAKASARKREAVLRVLCGRMKRETMSINKTIATMDTYLEIKSCSKRDADEAKRSKGSVSGIKGDIEELKRSLGMTSKRIVNN